MERASFETHGCELRLHVPDGAREATELVRPRARRGPGSAQLTYGIVPEARGPGLATGAAEYVVCGTRART